MTKTIEFFYDVASPWSYLASTQITKVAEQHSAELLYRPFLLGGVFKATHNQSPVSIPAKGAYMMKDIKRWCDRYNVAFVMPANFPINSLLPMRCLNAVEIEKRPEATKILFEAHWIDGRDVSDHHILVNLLGADIIEKANQEINKESLKMSTHKAVKRGAFGAPTFFIEDEMFFGVDRLDMLEYFLTKR